VDGLNSSLAQLAGELYWCKVLQKKVAQAAVEGLWMALCTSS